MAEKPTKILLSGTKLHGIVIRSTIDSGSILGVSLPKSDSRFFVLGPKDVPGVNSVEIFGDTMPLFASEDVCYRGQPLMALFGPDTESVEVKSRELEIDFQLSGKPSGKGPKHEHSPIVYSWGNVADVFPRAASTIERTYANKRGQTTEHTVTYVDTWLDDGVLAVEVPTQWPFHVRDTVASVCGRTKKSVNVIPKPHFSVKDEKLLLPSVLAAIAAIATVKSGNHAQIASRFPTFGSSVIITRKTALDTGGKPLAETVEAIVDQGAFPFFTAELFKQILVGLIPLYKLQAFSATVRIVESHAAPSHFYGDLGYSSALYSTEAHASAIARYCKMNPANWRIKHYAEAGERTSELDTMPIALLRDLIGHTCAAADFARHSAVYELQRRARLPLSAFLNYSRGVGIACGAGISGFSASSPLHAASKITITLDSNNRVLVNSSFYPTQRTTSLWRSMISRELSVERETISFLEGDTSNMADSGPEVLSLDVDRSVMMITQCCTAIKSKRFQEPLPITESVSARSVISGFSSQFVSRNWGCLIVELEVNTVTLLIEARRVWGRFSFANTYDIDLLTARFKHIVIMSLHECGVVPVYREGSPPLLDIAVDSLGEQTYPTSASCALRGMVFAACSSALSQAFNCDIGSMPVTSDEIMGYIRREE